MGSRGSRLHHFICATEFENCGRQNAVETRRKNAAFLIY